VVGLLLPMMLPGVQPLSLRGYALLLLLLLVVVVVVAITE
jgi:hypothetical protein